VPVLLLTHPGHCAGVLLHGLRQDARGFMSQAALEKARALITVLVTQPLEMPIAHELWTDLD
jgi:hypothetical protein